MPLHRQCEEVLRRVERWGDVASMSVAAARALEARRAAELGGTGPAMAEIRDLAIPTAQHPIPARLYRPRHDVAPGVLVWLHGGGWVVGSPEHCDVQARAFAAASNCAVLSVDYRLAPEHGFPAAPEDCYAATAWASENAPSLGAVPDRLAVGGDSAGGNLTAAVTLLARERSGPPIDFQLLVYPVMTKAADTPSYRTYAAGHWLTAEAMTSFWDHYLPRGEDGANALASPLLASSLAGLPPALVATAECDLLRDEGEQYAKRLHEAGVTVSLRRYDGMVHGFLACAAVVDDAWLAFEELGRAVGDELGRAGIAEAL
jgi:acetyl esterase